LNQPFDDELGMEGYQLDILASNVVTQAPTRRQESVTDCRPSVNCLMPPPMRRSSCATIVDFPRFSYRGMHLDVSRHFMPVSLIYYTSRRT